MTHSDNPGRYLPPALAAVLLLVLGPATLATAQPAPVVRGEGVPSEAERIYRRGLEFLARTQRSDGSWQTSYRYAVTSLSLLAFLAHGDDPNFGPYAKNVRAALRFIVSGQNEKTGFIGQSMYEHGFSMLAIAEAYGTVDESRLWEGRSPPKRSLAKTLELAVRCAVTSQKRNTMSAWRYSPSSLDADTSVSGAVLVGLLAARNAGIEVPDKVIDGALGYFRSMTSESGYVGYSGGFGGFGESMNRSCIATLVFAIGKKKKWPQFGYALKHITSNIEHEERGYPMYFRYYAAQAYFQGNLGAWQQWNRNLIKDLAAEQSDDGDIGQARMGGPAYSTAMSLLALALNFRFLPIYER